MDFRKALLVKYLTDIQDEEIRMSKNLPYVEGACEKLRPIHRPYNIRSLFYNEGTLRILICKLKDWVATEDKKHYLNLIVVTAN